MLAFYLQMEISPEPFLRLAEMALSLGGVGWGGGGGGGDIYLQAKTK